MKGNLLFSTKQSIRLLEVSMLTMITWGLLFFGWTFQERTEIPPFSLSNASSTACKEQLSFDLGSANQVPSFSFPKIQEEFFITLSKPRPNSFSKPLPLFIRFKKAKTSKQIALPSQVNLKFNELGFLEENEKGSPYWMDLEEEKNLVSVKVWAQMEGEEKVLVEKFSLGFFETPVLDKGQIRSDSPFSVLAEAKWWGKDLLLEKYKKAETLHRLEVGSPPSLLEIKENEWLQYENLKKQWTLAESLEGEVIFHIEKTDPKGMFLEGWHGEDHVRLFIPFVQNLPFKAKGEELFTSLRVRSDKQVSCSLEKQCFILKVGDWVLKENNRWKVLRRKESKEKVLAGALFGELFIFEKMGVKLGKKTMIGSLYNAVHTQAVPIEIAGGLNRKKKEEALKRVLPKRGGS